LAVVPFFGLLELSETCGMISLEAPRHLHMLQPGPGDVLNVPHFFSMKTNVGHSLFKVMKN